MDGGPQAGNRPCLSHGEAIKDFNNFLETYNEFFERLAMNFSRLFQDCFTFQGNHQDTLLRFSGEAVLTSDAFGARLGGSR